MKSKINKSIFGPSTNGSDRQGEGSSTEVENRGEAKVSTVYGTDPAVSGKIFLLIEKIKAGEIKTRIDLNGVVGSDRELLKGINEMLEVLIEPVETVIEYTANMAGGNTPEKVTGKYQGGFSQLQDNLNSTVDLIKGIVDEFGILMSGVREGKLEARARADRFPGVWRKILRGTNEVIDDFMRPLNIAAEYIERIGKGDIPQKVTEEYRGDFNEIKNNINACIDGLGGLVESSRVLKRMALNDYSKKVEGQYQGIYAETAVSVNEVMDRLLYIQGTVENIAIGDLSRLDEYKAIGKRSEEDNMMPGFIAMMGSIDGLNSEIIELTKAIGKGKLDYRADGTQFEGRFREVVLGMNNAIDALVAPLNVTAEYIDRVSKGDIPDKITDDYKGDFNEIKNNINACLDGLGGLVESSQVLKRMALNDYSKKVEGQYQGIYAETAVAVNEVRERLSYIQGTVEDIAIGDLSKLGEYRKIGKRSEEDNMMPGFIAMMGNIDGLNSEIIELTKAIEKGKLDYRADGTQFEGRFREVVLGMNNAIDALVAPLNVTAEYIDRVSKGDIPDKITDDYKGDFNEIKNNINACIDGLGGLVESSQVLKRMALNDYSKKVEGQYQGIYAETAVAVNEVRERLTYIQGTVENIAIGDLSKLGEYRKIGKRSEEDNMMPGFIAMMGSIDGLNSEIIELTGAIENGKLDYRADGTQFEGRFREVVQGMNNAIDALVAPLNVTAEYIDRVSKGDIPDKITDDYKGDFNEIKNNINACIDGLGGLVESTAVLKRMDLNDLTTMVEGEYQGIYAETANAVNGVRERLTNIQSICIQMAAGDYQEWLKTLQGIGQRSEEDKLMPALTRMMETIDEMSEEVIGLTVAAEAGKLDYRAAAEKFQGKYKEVVQGVNATVDTFVKPLNVMAEYVDRIGKGDIPDKITDDYKGDFNEIKNNINACIDGLGGLVESTAVLKRMDLNDLTTMVEGKYQGIYAETANAVNGVRERLTNIQSISIQMAAGDYQEWLKTLQGIGQRSEEDKLMPALTRMMETIDEMSEEVIGLTVAAEAGKLDYRAAAEKFQGKYKEVVQGVNATVDTFVKPLNVMAEYVDRIGKGDIPDKITDDYKGDFNEIKNNINACIDGLGGLVESTAVLKRMDLNDLTTMVEGEYQGIYAETANAVNGVRERLTNIQSISIQMAAGDYQEWLKTLQGIGQRSEEDKLMPALTRMMETIDEMSEEVIRIAHQAEEGNLSYRAVADKYEGKYLEVVQGVNNIVDVLVEPLMTAAGHIAAISKGDIPDTITRERKGDINEIKNSLNTLIDAMNEITNTAMEIAGGNLTVQVNQRSDKDILMKSLQEMVNNLQDIAAGLRDDSNELAGSAQELSANAEEITAGANETASTMIQVAATVAQVSDNAIKIKEVADRASEEAQKGQEDVNTVNSQMKEISESTDNAALVVKELNNTSDKIGKIVETIANIASQTNLLALNAAIEAARAGEHGRGFAVVAEEVRKLAEQSATAAEEIRELITTIQKESNRAVEVMNESMERVESGVEIVNQTGESFAQIIDQVRALAAQVDEIASGIEQTSAAVQNVTSITKESTAATEDMANATQAQAELAADLQEMAARFKLN